MKTLGLVALPFAALPVRAADHAVVAPAAPGGGRDQTVRIPVDHSMASPIARLTGVDTPTLKEAGVEVAVESRRMIAAPGLTGERQAAVSAELQATWAILKEIGLMQ